MDENFAQKHGWEKHGWKKNMSENFVKNMDKKSMGENLGVSWPVGRLT